MPDEGGEERGASRDARARESGGVAVAGLAWALLGAGAGAGESVVRALLHSYYFNTTRSFVSFLAVPAAVYAVGGFAAGSLVAFLLNIRPRGPRPAALPTALAAAPACLMLLYLASSFYERLQDSTRRVTLGEIALDTALTVATLLVFVMVRGVAARVLGWTRARRVRLARAAVLVVAVFLAVVGVGGWRLFFGPLKSGPRPWLPRGAPERPLNVVLIIIDTQRADRLGCYGYPAERSPKGDGLGTSPVMDALAGEGVRFDAAIVPEVVTDASVASLFTSLYPAEHGVTRNGVPLESGAITLAEILSANGYRTAAAVTVEHLDGCTSGMSQGFDEYFDRGWHDRFRHHVAWRLIPKPLKDQVFAHTAAASEANARAAAWLTRSDARPFFLWVHYFEPHTPYESHEVPGVLFDPAELESVPPWDTESLRAIAARAEALYDSEVREADTAVGELLDVLRNAGALDRTLVVVAADHGEHMSEARIPTSLWFTHADVYDETARVPLILWRPGVVPAGVVAEQVSTMDVGPTILDVVGATAPAVPTSGRSFTTLLEGSQLPPRPLAIDSNPHMEIVSRALRTGRWKLITRPDKARELYDISDDPHELLNVAQQDSALAGHLTRYLDRMVRGWGPGEASAPVDRETEQMLRALGYLR
jgi:arylsulfatase A-like enzyme